uniref:Uncharacterized protein n=1 Tax=Plectus sambesii TaxID=2011161 RepID=A0A914WZ26_9BILA
MEGAPSPEKRWSATCGMRYSGGRLGERHRRSGRSPAVRALVVTQSADYRLLTALTPSGASSTYPFAVEECIFPFQPLAFSTTSTLSTGRSPSSQFSSAFEAHVKRVVRLLWHCCGHLYSSHWDQLCMLGLRPQASLVLAHMDAFCSTANLLDAKDAAALRQTVALVRPPTVVHENLSTLTRNEPLPMDADPNSQPAHTTTALVNMCGPPKSGSWGGVPSPTSVDFGGCKPCAQTC